MKNTNPISFTLPNPNISGLDCLCKRYGYFVMEKEIFVDIKDYEGLYQISNYGRVKSLPKEWKATDTFVCTRKERILKLSIDKFGYYKINLWDRQKMKRFLVSRLVAIHFLPYSNKPQVNHKDGDKLNNYFENLEWVTGSENIQHAFNNGLINVSKGENHCHAKLKEKDIFQIHDMLENGYTHKQIAIELQISSVQKIIEGESWKHVGIDFSKFRRKPPSSKYKCVYYSISHSQKNWAARTRIKGKDYFLGYFKEEIEAFKAYQNFINTNT